MSEYKKIKSSAQEYRTQPPDSAWQKLEQQLELDTKITRLNNERRKFVMYSVLAFGFVCSLVAIIVFESVQQPAEIYNGQIAEWEELESPETATDLYDLQNVRILDKALQKDSYQEYLNRLSKVSGHTYKKIGVKNS